MRLAKRLGLQAAYAQIAAVIVCGFSALIISHHGIQQGYYSADTLHASFNSALHWADQSNGHSFGASAAVVERRIIASHPGFYVYQGTKAAAYRYLRAHDGGDGTVFITGVSPHNLTLVARQGNDAIAEMKGDVNDKTSIANLYSGQAVWENELWPILGIEDGALILFFLSFAFSGLRKDKRRQQEVLAASKSWHELVPADCLYGPTAPKQRFSLLAPVCREHHGVSWFEAVVMDWRPVERFSSVCEWVECKEGEPHKTIDNPDGTKSEMVWRGGGWQDYTPLPETVKAFRAPIDADISEASDVWFSFCRQVAEQNERAWSVSQENKLKRRQLKELAEASPLGQILTPAAKVLEGLGPQTA